MDSSLAQSDSTVKWKYCLLQILLCTYFVLSIFETYISVTIGSVSKYYILLLAFFLICYSKPTLRLIAVPFLIWFVYLFTSLLWTRDFAMPKLHFMSIIGMIILLTALLSPTFDKKTLVNIETTYLLASGLAGFLSIFFAAPFLWKIGPDARWVLTLFGAQADPNNMAIFYIIGICIGASNLLYHKRLRILSVIIIVINCSVCLRTGSRAGFLTLALMAFLFFFLFVPFTKKAFLIRIAIILGAIALLCLGVFFFFPQLLELRVFDLAAYQGGSGRIWMWSNVLEHYTHDLATILFGDGWGSGAVSTNCAFVVHNTYLTMLCDVGLFGTVLFMAPLLYASIRLLKKKIFFPFVFLVSQFAPAFFIDMINKRFFWNGAFIVLLYYVVYCKNSGITFKDKRLCKITMNEEEQ